MLLCTFNGAKYLAQQLDSILEQSRAVDKISIFDDGSSDATLAIIAAFSERHGTDELQIAVTRNAINLGWMQNFANAIEQSTGDILFLCDQDDIWLPHKVEKMTEALARADVDLAFSDGSLIDAGGAPFTERSALQVLGSDLAGFSAPGYQPFYSIQKANFIGGASMALKAHAAKAALPHPKKMPIDYWLALRACAMGRAHFVNLRLYQYRQHGNNVIGLRPVSTAEALRKIWRQPFSDRAREREMWVEIAGRVAEFASAEIIEFTQQKRTFLRHSTASAVGFGPRLSKLLGILRCLAQGDYRRFAPPLSAWADIAATVRKP